MRVNWIRMAFALFLLTLFILSTNFPNKTLDVNTRVLIPAIWFTQSVILMGLSFELPKDK